jgi:hypothetical protein
MKTATPPSPSGGSRGAVMVDVARLAGVSQKTVSRVVNGAPHVRPDVRERVERAIEQLGYRPNPAAQALARERSHTIGVLALGTRFFGPSRRVFTLEHEARRLGYTMALTSVPDLSAQSVADGIDALLKRGVEGLVVEVPTHLIDLDPAQLAGLPVVTRAGWITGVPRQAVCRHRPRRGLSRADELSARHGSQHGMARGGPTRLGRCPETPPGLAIGSS